MQPDAMTIPARTDEEGVARAAQTGPVFSVDAATAACTCATRPAPASIEWKDDAATRAAVACLEAVLAGAVALRSCACGCEAGMGLVGHNVLHDRSAFEDDASQPRLLYRARFLDRVDLPAEEPWRNG